MGNSCAKPGTSGEKDGEIYKKTNNVSVQKSKKKSGQSQKSGWTWKKNRHKKSSVTGRDKLRTKVKSIEALTSHQLYENNSTTNKRTIVKIPVISIGQQILESESKKQQIAHHHKNISLEEIDLNDKNDVIIQKQLSSHNDDNKSLVNTTNLKLQTDDVSIDKKHENCNEIVNKLDIIEEKIESITQTTINSIPFTEEENDDKNETYKTLSETENAVLQTTLNLQITSSKHTEDRSECLISDYSLSGISCSNKNEVNEQRLITTSEQTSSMDQNLIEKEGILHHTNALADYFKTPNNHEETTPSLNFIDTINKSDFYETQLDEKLNSKYFQEIINSPLEEEVDIETSFKLAKHVSESSQINQSDNLNENIQSIEQNFTSHIESKLLVSNTSEKMTIEVNKNGEYLREHSSTTAETSNYSESTVEMKRTEKQNISSLRLSYLHELLLSNEQDKLLQEQFEVNEVKEQVNHDISDLQSQERKEEDSESSDSGEYCLASENNEIELDNNNSSSSLEDKNTSHHESTGEEKDDIEIAPILISMIKIDEENSCTENVEISHSHQDQIDKQDENKTLIENKESYIEIKENEQIISNEMNDKITSESISVSEQISETLEPEYSTCIETISSVCEFQDKAAEVNYYCEKQLQTAAEKLKICPENSDKSSDSSDENSEENIHTSDDDEIIIHNINLCDQEATEISETIVYTEEQNKILNIPEIIVYTEEQNIIEDVPETIVHTEEQNKIQYIPETIEGIPETIIHTKEQNKIQDIPETIEGVPETIIHTEEHIKSQDIPETIEGVPETIIHTEEHNKIHYIPETIEGVPETIIHTEEEDKIQDIPENIVNTEEKKKVQDVPETIVHTGEQNKIQNITKNIFNTEENNKIQDVPETIVHTGEQNKTQDIPENIVHKVEQYKIHDVPETIVHTEEQNKIQGISESIICKEKQNETQNTTVISETVTPKEQIKSPETFIHEEEQIKIQTTPETIVQNSETLGVKIVSAVLKKDIQVTSFETSNNFSAGCQSIKVNSEVTSNKKSYAAAVSKNLVQVKTENNSIFASNMQITSLSTQETVQECSVQENTATEENIKIDTSIDMKTTEIESEDSVADKNSPLDEIESSSESENETNLPDVKEDKEIIDSSESEEISLPVSPTDFRSIDKVKQEKETSFTSESNEKITQVSTEIQVLQSRSEVMENEKSSIDHVTFRETHEQLERIIHNTAASIEVKEKKTEQSPAQTPGTGRKSYAEALRASKHNK